MKRRILSIITALALCLSLCPTWALAAEADPALCPHHREHTEDCGYIAPSEGQPCGHEHTDECYTLGALPDTDSGDYYEIGADTENLLDCQHVHDSECGYVQADPGQPCGFVCRTCPVEALIAALPDKVTEDNAEDVRGQLDEILALFSVLTEDEQEQIDLSRCYALQGALDGANAPMPLTGAVSYVDADGTTRQSPEDCTVLTAEMAGTELSGGWYVAQGDVNVGSNLFTFTKDAHLILSDGCNLTGTIYAKGSLTIYAQSGGSGSLTATRGSGTDPHALNSDQTITINGGRITATGSDCAAIGGANQKNGAVVINGGTVTASTSGSTRCGAAIGGGAGGDGLVIINGGRVNATSSMNKLPQADISSGAAIGGGFNQSTAGIDGPGLSSGDGTVTITGGTVYASNQGTQMPAVGGDNSSVRVSGGFIAANNSKGTAFDGNPSFQNAIVSSNGAGNVYGSAELTENITIGTGKNLKSLHIPYGASLSGSGNLTISLNGSFTTENLTADMIQVPASANTSMTEEEIAASLTIQNPTVCGQTCTVTGWSGPVVAKKDGTDSTYTATYTLNSDTNVTVTKEFEVFQLATKTVKYLDETGAEREVEATVITGGYGDRTEALRDGGWYVVEGEATRKAISAGANSHLILADGCALEATLGVNSGKSLNVYAQSVSGGQWTLPAGKDPNSPGNLLFVGIHCKGNLTVYGGSLSSTPTEIYSNGSLTVSGGSVTVKPDPSSTSSAVVDNYGVLTHNGGALTIQQGLSTFAGSGRYDTSILPENTALSAGTLADNGTDQSEAVRVQAVPDLRYSGQLFELVGWTLSTVSMVGGDTSKYQVVYTKDGSGEEVTLTMTLPQEAGVQTVSYLEADGTEKKAECTVLTSNLTGTLSGGWYVLKGEVTGQISTPRDGTAVNLILADGCHFKGQITVSNNFVEKDQLNIYAQSTGADIGRITATSIIGIGISVSGQLVINGGRIISPSISIMSGSTTINGGMADFGNVGNFAGNFNRNGGILFEKGVGTVYGNVVLSGTHDIPAGYSLHIPAGASLSGCTLTGGGSYTTGNITSDMISADVSDLRPSAADQSEAVKARAALTGKAVICGQTFTADVSGWTLDVAKKSDSEYTITYSKDRQNVSKTVTLVDCVHRYEGYTHIPGTTTHAQTCALCGAQSDPQKCDFTQDACVCGAKLAVTLPDDLALTYNGKEQKPGVTVTVNGQTLAAANNYTVTYDNNIDAGDTAKVTVTGTSFEGTVELSFSIGKATPTIAWDPSYQVLTYTGQPADIKPVITLVNGETYDGPIYYTWPGFTNQLVLPTDAGFNGITASIPAKGNYTAAETEQVLILQINKANQDAPSAPTAVEENIKDNRITLDTIENAEYKRDEGEWQTSPVFTGLDPNHEYTFYVRLKEDKNHNASPSSAGAAITTKKTMLDGATVTVSGSYTYTGAAVVPAAGNVTVELNGVTIDASQYTISATNNVNVGTSTLTVTATADGNYSGSASTTFTISPATLTIKASDQTITYGQSITEGTGQVTATGLCAGDSLRGITLAASTRNVPGGTIELSAAQIKNSSGGDVTANYNITYEAGTLTINKAQATVTGDPTANTLTYTGAAQALVTAGTASIGEVVYSLTEMGTYSTTIPTGTNAGTYTVWYKVEGTTNYEGTAPVKVDVTIGKANYTGLMTASTSCKYGRDKTYDMSDLLPEGYVLGTITITDTNSIFEGTPTVSGAMLTYKLVNDSQKVNSTGTITIPVTESTNYNPFDLTITVTVTNVRIPNLNVNPISVIYTGNPVNSNQITGTATVDGIAIDGTWSFVSGQAITNVADSGVKRVTFTPNNTDLYGASTGTVVVTISKATPSLILTPSPATLPNGGMVTLTLSGLPDRSSATVTCSDENITVTKGSGNTWTAELPAGGASYTFAASYAGDGNHNGATANCTVRVEKITPVLSMTASPASPLIGGGTVTLTLSGLPAGGTASVTCSGGITVTVGAGNTWTAKLPNSTADYIFTASYAGNDSYHGANATCTVETKEVVILPNPPADDGSTKFQLVMKDGISKVPAGLQNIEALNTPEKLETAMKTAITQANSGVPQANTAVYDVELQISTDGGTTWTKATAGNFPANGLTVTLPYPAGTNSSYTFTVVHMFTTSDFGKTPGDIETPRVINTASGLQFTVTGLSPVSVGWTAPATTPDTPSGGNHGGGGGGSVSTYAITVEKSEHGKVTSNRTNASNGSTVTLTVTPDSGYVLDALTVTDSRGNEIKLTAQSGGKYTFTMPSRAVTVKASFVPLPDDTQKPCDGGADCPSRSFTDLGSVGTWYHEAVDYVLRNDLMGGYGNGQFGPNNNLTRAQFAQILFNKEGRPVVNYLLQYGDVAEGAWYTEAIRWATSRGIVGGYGNGMFGPNDNITREQLAVMLWRYAGSPAATDKELHFTDADKASGYALEALRWAVENGVMIGKGNGQLAPQGLATRGQVAQMLMNFLKNR